ncbi:hypothetical protein F4777DRAFT_334859 [Nemania sp. FL0916]|nr:hypothetical protein F4777DRAFT_334859 [Nemania sp. FL0916]
MRQVSPPPLTRQEVVSICPGLQSSPTEVRHWIQKYLVYRGIEGANANKFFWRGIELHRASYVTLIEAFKQHCGIVDWEAEVLAYDVYTIVEGSIPPPKRGIFQKYVEEVFGYDFYCGLMMGTRPHISLMDRVNCGFCWLQFIIIHSVLTLILMVITLFLLNT